MSNYPYPIRICFTIHDDLLVISAFTWEIKNLGIDDFSDENRFFMYNEDITESYANRFEKHCEEFGVMYERSLYNYNIGQTEGSFSFKGGVFKNMAPIVSHYLGKIELESSEERKFFDENVLPKILETIFSKEVDMLL